MDKQQITPALVARLIATQFPQWANLEVSCVEPSGWDNATFRLGESMSVRLPTAERYAPQVEKEHRWLPVLARRLPLPIPQPLARGAPGQGYPWPWSVNHWLEGERASVERIEDLPRFAAELAKFLQALYSIDPSGGPLAGRHNFFRGGPLSTYDAETREAISALVGTIDADAVTRVWEVALEASWRGSPRWVHGDVSAANLLVRGGRLSAVIDFGSSGIGDPACDTVIAWTFLRGASREAFLASLPVDSATWARGRGWALWKALITLARASVSAKDAAGARRVIADLVAAHER